MGQPQEHANQLCQISQVLDMGLINLIGSAESQIAVPTLHLFHSRSKQWRIRIWLLCAKPVNLRRFAWRRVSLWHWVRVKCQRDNRPPGLALIEGAFHFVALGTHLWISGHKAILGFDVSDLYMLCIHILMSTVCFVSIWSGMLE